MIIWPGNTSYNKTKSPKNPNPNKDSPLKEPPNLVQKAKQQLS